MMWLRSVFKSDTRLLITGLIIMVLFAVFQPEAATSNDPGRSASVRNTRPGGAMALRLWLEEIGYDVREITSDQIDPNGLDVLLILEPNYPYSVEEAYRVYNWVVEGHTLIVVGSGSITDSLLEPYQMRFDDLVAKQDVLAATSPILNSPPVDQVFTGGSFATIESKRTDLAVHFISSENQPSLVSFAAGHGTVWVIGIVRPFTNIGLQDENGGKLILNLLADVPTGATIGFDEALLAAPAESGGLTQWLLTTRPGWSILAAMLLSFVFLVLRGRRFAEPVPIMQDQMRREPVEYIVAMANLNRRSGQRAAMLKHYRSELRRAFIRRYALDPDVSDTELVHIATTNTLSLDGAALLQLLQQLSAKSVSEQELVRLAMQVDEWIGDRR